MDFDVIIIGSGVTGSAVAYELGKTNLKTLVLEKEEDVCEGTTKANSGICHSGLDAKPGSLKAKLNVKGNRMMPKLAQKLNFDFKNNGSLVLCFDEANRPELEELLAKGKENGVEGLEILEKEQVLEKEPHVSEEVVCAIWAPTGGIVCPFSLNYALAENAADNGVEFRFHTPVTSVEPIEGGWLVNGELTTKYVVNAAGVYADTFHNMADPEHPIHITPRKGEYFLLDHGAADRTTATLFQLPTKMGKGVLVTPTVHNNLLVGPTAYDIENKEGVNTTQAGLDEVRAKASLTMKDIPFNQIITSFAGLRATGDTGDFIIQECKDGFIDAAGIESPGLSSAPAIGEMVADMIKEKLEWAPKENYIDERKGFVKVDELTADEWNALIKEDPAYGNIICRCETITEGSIIDACTRSIPAKTLDGVKRRVRAGMGRCQAGFCSPKTMEIISRIQNVGLDEVKKSGSGSRIITGKDKEGAVYGK